MTALTATDQKARTRVYRAGGVEKDNFPVEDISDYLAFITPKALVTIRKDDQFDTDEVLHRWDGSPDLAHNGVGFLLHGLIDHVVDGHFEAVESLDEEIEKLEDLLFDQQSHDGDVQRRSFELRTSLTIQGNRLNVISKKVTSWAAIIAAPTAITGFFGQNVPYPGFSTSNGFLASSILMVLLSASLYLAFKSKNWL